jgi:hypothetical protein
LILDSQSTFIKGRTIHDSFKFAQASTRQLFVRRKPTILFKTDITKAFDTVAWSFLLEVLEHLGFTTTWINWVAELLRTASTKVLLNGTPGDRIRHDHGLRQGDLLSSMLFILVMNILDVMFRKAEEWSLLGQLGVQGITHHASLYTDDVMLFLSPVATELQTAYNIFRVFQGASRLTWNLSKCQIAPIKCEANHLELAALYFPCSVIDFPLRYLGIPLSISSLPKVVWQRLIDSMADKLLAWKGRLMHKSGRLALIKFTLATMPVHTDIGLELRAWVRKAMVKIMCSFLWTSTDSVQGRRCAIAWNSV